MTKPRWQPNRSIGFLVRKHSGVDPLFTEEGYRDYVDDLLERMTNPFLRDTAERVGRDPGRKLGWDDRLIGTIRLTLAQGMEPRRRSHSTEPRRSWEVLLC